MNLERRERREARDNAGVVGGVILIGLGLAFLAGQFLDIRIGQYSWPFFVIVPGLAFFVAMVAGGRSAGALAVPGSVVTTVGLILLFQNLTNRWETWSYAWALIPTAVGVGLMIHGSWSDLPRLRERGGRLATIGIVLFALFGAFFELGLNLSGGWFARQLIWPLALIALGVFLLLRRRV